MLKLSHTMIRKGIAAGRLRESLGRDARGRPFIADVELAEREWNANATKPSNGGGHAGNGNQPRPQQGTLVQAQLRVADERATALSLDNQRRRGELLDAGKVQQELFEFSRTVRDRLRNIPDRIAPDLAAETDPRRVTDILLAEIDQALVSLAEVLERG